MDIEKLFSGIISHSYIFSGSDYGIVIPKIENLFSIKFGSNQNAILYKAENFSIDDSRAISEMSNLLSEGETFIVISSRSIGHEAQHALLKTVEEPRAGMHFLIFVDNPEILLPTIRSRCILISKTEVSKSSSSHPDFLAITLADRFEYIENVSKKFKKDNPTAFRDVALEIFDTVIDVLRKKIGANTTSTEREQLERILELRNYLNDRGSSAKQLLETMAMQLTDH